MSEIKANIKEGKSIQMDDNFIGGLLTDMEFEVLKVSAGLNALEGIQNSMENGELNLCDGVYFIWDELTNHAKKLKEIFEAFHSAHREALNLPPINAEK